MNESNSKPEKPNERRFSQEQYDMLKRCSDKKDMAEWNKWREEDMLAEIWLQKAPLEGAYLEEVWLFDAHLEGASLRGSHMERAQLERAHLEGANLFDTNLKGANLRFAGLGDAKGEYVRLEGADLTRSVLKGADLTLAILHGADFTASIVDGSTLLWDCFVDRKTDFRGVGLESAMIEPSTRQLLEYNIRRMNWEDWYPKQHRLLAWLVRKFWQISDYGISTKGVTITHAITRFSITVYAFFRFLADIVEQIPVSHPTSDSKRIVSFFGIDLSTERILFLTICYAVIST